MASEEIGLWGGRGGGGSRSRRNRSVRLNAKAAGARNATGARSAAGGRVAVALFALAVMAGVVALAWMGLNYLGKRLFSANPVYTISRLEIAGDSDVVSYFIREKKKIREGTNLFAFDIEALREEFLKLRFAAKYKSMQIARELPGTLKIQVTERTPVARLPGGGGLVADADGFVFGLGQGRQALPLLVGIAEPPLPGERLTGNARDAVALLDLCERTGLNRELAITGIDVSGGFRGREDDIRVLLLEQVEADVWWQRGQDSTPASLADLRGRLQFLVRVMAYGREHGKRLKTVNLTLESYSNNCPATYWES